MEREAAARNSEQGSEDGCSDKETSDQEDQDGYGGRLKAPEKVADPSKEAEEDDPRAKSAKKPKGKAKSGGKKQQPSVEEVAADEEEDQPMSDMDEGEVDVEMEDVAKTHKRNTGKATTVFHALVVSVFLRGEGQAQVVTGVHDSADSAFP